MKKIEINEKRNYGIDALRMLSMFTVVVIHVLGHGGVLFNTSGAQYAGAWFLRTCVYFAVNAFAMISGFVGYKAKHRYASLGEMWLRVVFYSVPFCLTEWYIYREFSLKRKILYALFPVFGQQYWYFTMYFGLFLFMPLLNKAIEGISRKQFKYCCITFIAAFSILQQVKQTDLFEIYYGYSTLWLMVMYLIGAYIGKYNAFAKIKKLQALLGYAGCTLLAFSVKMLLHYHPVTVLGLDIEEDIFISYISIAIVGQALFLLLFFRNLNLHNITKKVLTVVTPLAFSVYLIHENSFMRRLFIEDKFEKFASYSVPLMISIVLGGAFAIFVVCLAIDYVREKIFKLLRVKKILAEIEARLLKS